MNILCISLIVFSVTLILTKARILACKRQYVEKRYAASKVGGNKPSFIHTWFYKMWTCPMCSGFWVACAVCLHWHCYGWMADVLIAFGLNWLLHCFEDILVNLSLILKELGLLRSEIKEYFSLKNDH